MQCPLGSSKLEGTLDSWEKNPHSVLEKIWVKVFVEAVRELCVRLLPDDLVCEGDFGI